MIVEDIIETYIYIFVGLLVAMGGCLIIIALMRWMATPLVWLSIIGVIGMLGFGKSHFWICSREIIFSDFIYTFFCFSQQLLTIASHSSCIWKTIHQPIRQLLQMSANLSRNGRKRRTRGLDSASSQLWFYSSSSWLFSFCESVLRSQLHWSKRAASTKSNHAFVWYIFWSIASRFQSRQFDHINGIFPNISMDLSNRNHRFCAHRRTVFGFCRQSNQSNCS